MDEILRLSSGATARVRGLVVFRGHHESTVTVVVHDRTPASGDERALSEALELANLHDQFARREHIGRIAVSVCETEDCIDLKQPPAVIMFFRRNDAGAWSLDEVIEE